MDVMLRKGPCFAKVAKLMLRKGKGILHCIGKVYYTRERRSEAEVRKGANP